MSVYTEINQTEMQTILEQYTLGKLKTFQGISAGIENSNFFVNTDQGRFVLTLFERMQEDELPYFMNLMQHLSSHGVPCPVVQRLKSQDMLFNFKGKKGCIITCLKGKTLHTLNKLQLENAGRMLAILHNAGKNFQEKHPNPTNLKWVKKTIKQILPSLIEHYDHETTKLLQDELNAQKELDTSELVSGVIHADYFVDNILISGNQVSGVIDFYYACNDTYVYDLAIATNALAFNDTVNMTIFIHAYQEKRRLSQKEIAILPMMLRRAALRFWVSRLYDAFFPRKGMMIHTKDPKEYQNKLLFLRENSLRL